MNQFRHQLFNRIANYNGDMLVCLQSGKSLSGGQLSERIDAVVVHLVELGIRPGQRVLALMPNGLAFAVLYLACLKGRFVIVPMNPRTSQEDLEYAIKVSQPRLMVISESEATTAGLRRDRLDDETMLGLSATASASHDYVIDDLFSINFTSGTTNRPKAVAHAAENMLGNADAFNRFINYGSNERMMHVMPMFYMAGLLNTLLCPLLAGSSVILGAQFSPRSALTFFRQAADNKISAFWLSPSMVQMAMQLDRGKNTSDYMREVLKFPFVGTAPLSAHLARDFRDRYGINLLQSYGLSELLLIAVDRPAFTKGGSVGFLIPEVTERLAGDGELLISTPFAFTGYLDPETGAEPDRTTARAMTSDFPTGDLATIDADKRITISGRKKDIIVVGGINVSPTAIEDALTQHPLVRLAAVVSTPHPVLGEAPLAFIVLVQGAPADTIEDALREFADARFERAARPVQYIIRASLPVGPTGKIQKHLLSLGPDH